MKAFICLLISFLFLYTVPALARCGTATDMSVETVVKNVKKRCCIRATRSRRNTCIDTAIRTIKKASSLLGSDFRNASIGALRQLKESSCTLAPEETGDCSDANLLTMAETVRNIKVAACNLKKNSARQTKLNSFISINKSVKQQFGTRYNTRLNTELKRLLKSKSCGAGGQKPKSGCGRILSARDGVNGNVYKLSDHSPHYPVFVTHNGARSGSAINSSGKRLDTLRYSGLGNPDPGGLRHHYRFNRSCRSFPKGFFIKLGNICYRVDSPCSRID